MHVRVFLAAFTIEFRKGVICTGKRKGLMSRKTNHRLWTLFLMLALIGSGVVTTPRIVRADLDQGETPTPAPPQPGIGDPDFPTNTGRMPKPGTTRGAVHQPVVRDYSSMHGGQMAMWWKGVRMALTTVFRGFFRP